MQQNEITRGDYVKVSRAKALQAQQFGIHTVRDAFLGPGKHGGYYIRVDDLPESVVAKLTGGRKPRTSSTITNRRTPTSPDTLVIYGGEKAEFTPGSVRQALYDAVIANAVAPIPRWELIGLVAENTDHSEHTIGATMSFFIHDTEILNIVE